ncbi:hypothetical protein [Calidifontibacillus oryziterrae]|uniref:hypothetical protein n=1 Tax=Calidifontibacillus oryziterrae TaxID=1191699 RepID=UPI0002F566A0|nr:hypothetical protein [Calidifontibacillus oryziterrae]
MEPIMVNIESFLLSQNLLEISNDEIKIFKNPQKYGWETEYRVVLKELSGQEAVIIYPKDKPMPLCYMKEFEDICLEEHKHFNFDKSGIIIWNMESVYNDFFIKIGDFKDVGKLGGVFFAESGYAFKRNKK